MKTIGKTYSYPLGLKGKYGENKGRNEAYGKGTSIRKGIVF